MGKDREVERRLEACEKNIAQLLEIINRNRTTSIYYWIDEDGLIRACDDD